MVYPVMVKADMGITQMQNKEAEKATSSQQKPGRGREGSSSPQCTSV
jgi:hypothetical protein